MFDFFNTDPLRKRNAKDRPRVFWKKPIVGPDETIAEITKFLDGACERVPERREDHPPVFVPSPGSHIEILVPKSDLDRARAALIDIAHDCGTLEAARKRAKEAL